LVMRFGSAMVPHAAQIILVMLSPYLSLCWSISFSGLL